MFQVGVRNEGQGFTVVVRNPNTGYTFVGESYKPKATGPFGPNGAAYQEAQDRALADAKDWAAKFKGAHIKVEVVEVMS